MLGLSTKSLVVAVAVLAGVSACGGASGPSASVVPRASATPTVDPAVAEVEAAAKHYVDVEAHTGLTGDASELDPLVVPNSQAFGNDGAAATNSHISGSTFVPTQMNLSAWVVSVTSGSATVQVTLNAYGHMATWPTLKPTESDHALGPRELSFTFLKVGNAWLLDRIG